MRVFRSADHAFSPWKNGGGTTAEIAIGPPGATLDAFDWRINDRTRHIRIEKVLYQPEAAGDFHL